MTIGAHLTSFNINVFTPPLPIDILLVASLLAHSVISYQGPVYLQRWTKPVSGLGHG